MLYETFLIRFRDTVLARRPVQALIFTVILGLSLGLLMFGRAHLPADVFEKHGYAGIFVVNLITCASVLFPIPGEAANIAAGSALNPLAIAAVATVGATLGEMTSYLVGYMGGRFFLQGYHQRYEQAQGWMERHGFATVFLFALVPILVYDLVGIIAGSTRYPVRNFVLATAAGRFLRCLAEAALGYSLISLFWPF